MFQILIVSVVKMCKQCILQTALTYGVVRPQTLYGGFAPAPPVGVSVPKPLAYSSLPGPLP